MSFKKILISSKLIILLLTSAVFVSGCIIYEEVPDSETTESNITPTTQPTNETSTIRMIPNAKFVFPKTGSIISGIGILAANELNGIIPKDISNIEFSYSDNNLDWNLIGKPMDSNLLYWETLWDTTEIPEGKYTVKIKVVGKDGTSEDTIEVFVNKEPIPEFEAYISELGDAVVFDGSSSYDPDGKIIEQKWEFSDNTSLTGEIVNYPIELPEPNFTGETNFSLEHIVVDNRQTYYTEHHIIVVEWEDGNPTIVSLVSKTCGCQNMEIKNTNESYADQYWMPEGSKKKLGAYDNISMAVANNPPFQIIHNFNVIANLYPHSDPTKCGEEQRVKFTASFAGATFNKSGNESSGDELILGPTVECPFGGDKWCDDDYRRPNQVTKFHVDQSRIIWLDGPGADSMFKNWLPFTCKYNFEAKVWGPLGWCKCTFVVNINTTTGKNQIENLVCTSG